jgi:hypothetical protein
MKERGLLAVTVLAFGIAAVACGGPDKPPMTPDSPDMSGIDAGGGSDVPTTPTPIVPSTPSAK